MPRDMELAKRIQLEVAEGIAAPQPEVFMFSDHLTMLAGNEPKRFLMALQGYMKSPLQLVPLQELLDGIVDFDFAIKLKKIRTAYWSRRWSARPNEDDGLDQYVPKNFHQGTDIGDVFNYRYWLRWEEPDPEDWKHGFLDCVDPEPDVIKDWEDSFERILPNSIKEVNPMEILLSVSSSASRLPSGNRSKVFKDKANGKLNRFSKSPLRGYRTLVYKGPTEVRDAITTTIEQSNTIKWIERQLAEICQDLPFSAYGLSPEDLEYKLNKFYDPDCWYYNRDLTKEGITKPRWIMMAIQRVLIKKYPKIEAFKYMDIYRKYSVVDLDGVEHPMRRGHGLGMGNALTTLMQCGTFNYTTEKLAHELDKEVTALFYNDDATVKCKHEDDVTTFAELETDLLLGLGLIPKEKKTYASNLMILCERYYPKIFSRKVSFSEYIRRLPFAATCILDAKVGFGMVDDPAYGKFDPALLPMLIRFWGVEYSFREAELPWWAGGWLRPRYNGVDLTFVDEPPLTQELFRGMHAGVPRLRPDKFIKKMDTRWDHPVTQFYRWKTPLDPEIERTFDLNQPLGKIQAKYHRGFKRSETEAWLRSEIIKRYKILSAPAKPLDIVGVYEWVINKYPDIDFIPPYPARTEMEWEVAGESREGEPQFPRQPNKLLATIAFWDSNRYIPKVIPYPYWPGDGELFIPSDRWDRYRESILSLPGVPKLLLPPVIQPTMEICLFKRYFMDDYRVNQAWQAVTGLKTFIRPTVLSPRGALMQSRQDDLFLYAVRGFQIAWDVWCLVSRLPAIIMMYGFFTDEDWTNFFRELGDVEDTTLDPGLLFKEELPPEKEVTVDFGIWYSDHRNYEPAPYLKEIFISAKEYISNWNLVRSLLTLSGSRTTDSNVCAAPAEGSARDILIRKLCKLEGSQELGVYHYQFPSQDDLWAGDGSESEGGGLFGFLDS